MPRLKEDSLAAVGKKVADLLKKSGIQLTLGGEPSYVPIDPDGPEWSVTAVGPTKLKYAQALAAILLKKELPLAVPFFSPGKTYPGEVNPRWAIHLLWNRDGTPLFAQADEGARPSFAAVKSALTRGLKVKNHWIQGRDPADRKREVWVLPLDHDGQRWISKKWPLSPRFNLLPAEGPAGLRLPLNLLPEGVSKRALTMEEKEGSLHFFLPPLLQPAFNQLLRLFKYGAGVQLGGYIPEDEAHLWGKLSLTPDPGVLEINLPPCRDAADYARWMTILERGATEVGLRSCKQRGPDDTYGTGGGNHLLFGAPSLETNTFFTHPRWITSILRYWQRHPSLSYLFTGDYVGPSSQAPRPDESSRALYDLEMAYQFLEKLPAGVDQRNLISETLRHLHTDGSGNTHRSEISFDKFWNASWAGGCRGLIEFRAVETMPHAEWMSAVAALWQALAAMLFEKKIKGPLLEQSARLHDYFFLPSLLWQDFAEVLRDLRRAGLAFAPEHFQKIWNWRFPQMLAFENQGAQLTVRKALEGWPLLCETPLEGGSTSRFVDTSMERLEFVANEKFFGQYRIFVSGRELSLPPARGGQHCAGLRYRRTALYPSLHPGIAPHMPLRLEIAQAAKSWNYRLENEHRIFQPDTAAAPAHRAPCKKLKPELLTYDLRLT